MKLVDLHLPSIRTRRCLTAVSSALLRVGTAGVIACAPAAAVADHCDDLEKAVIAKLEEYLQTRLAVAVTSKSIELIGGWRTEYNADQILSAEWDTANSTLGSQKQAVEHAEIDYLDALNEHKEHCPNEQ